MFNLETAIEEWKEGFADVGSLRKVDVLELESHLRELVTKLARGELNEHEAFLVAAQRLGQPANLNKEFVKVHGTTIWRKRIFWMICGYFAYCLGYQWFGALANLAVAGIGVTVGPTTMGATTMGATSVAVWAIGWATLLAFGFFKSKTTMAGPDHIPFPWVCVGGFALALGFVTNQAAGLVLMRYSLDARELGMMYLWRGIGHLVINVCVFVATVALAWTLSEPKSDAVDAAA